MFKQLLNFLITATVIISIGLIGYTYFKYDSTIKDPLIKQISNNIVVELPEYYTYSVDNAYLTSYILKTGIFALDKSITLDGFYHKDWLPLAFNYCSILKKDAFQVDNDFDNDGIPDFKDMFPYDYSNRDYSIRKSNTLDFDNDGLANLHDKDADGNGVDDIFQGICMDREANKDLIKKLYPKKAKDLFLTNKDDVVNKLNDLIFTFLDKYKIDDPFQTDEQADIFIESLFNRLLFEDDVVVAFGEEGDKTLIIEKKDIMSGLHSNNDSVDYNE